MNKLAVSIVLFSVLMGSPEKSEAQDHIRARLGFSTVSGLVGLEYQKGSTVFGIGLWRPISADGVTDINGEELDDLSSISIGARYFLEPEESGLFGGLSFIINSEGDIEVDEDYNFTKTVGYNALFLTGGYRVVLGDRIDLTVGAGYGFNLGLSESAKESINSGAPSIDLTLGFAIK